MYTLPKLSNEEGFTILEIVIASAIMIVLGLLISTMLFNTSKQQNQIQTRSERAEFLQQTMLDLRMNPIPTPSP